MHVFLFPLFFLLSSVFSTLTFKAGLTYIYNGSKTRNLLIDM